MRSERPSRTLRFILLSKLALALTCQAELRTWVLEDGRHFEATYESFDRGRLNLKSESGKSATFPIAKVSVVDRYYLKQTQEIPAEQMEGGNIQNAEMEIKLDRSVIKDTKPVRMKGDDYDLEFKAVTTPHFIFMYGKGVKATPYAELYERIWFSHAYRTPGFVKEWGTKKKAFLLIKSEKEYEELWEYFEDTNKERYDTRRYNQIKQGWLSARGSAHFHIPQDYADQQSVDPWTDIMIADKSRTELERWLKGHVRSQWMTYCHILRGISWHDEDDPQHVLNNYGVSTLTMCADNRINDNTSYIGMGGKVDEDSRGTGGLGEVTSWGKDLIKSVNKGDTTASFDFIYNPPSWDPGKTSQDQWDDFTRKILAGGRFYAKDLDHMLKRCELLEFMRDADRFPNHDELAKFFGYASSEELDEAFKKFVLKDNVKL